ncbi:hypothetical protein GA0061096_3223 [Fictibacillus enclensis]|nr:hypothetical protein GA0061096_3223 [Fictibacillus enclensis]
MKKHIEEECFFIFEGFFNDLFIPPGVTRPVFEDFTCNHNKILFVIRSDQPLSISIRSRGSCNPIQEIISNQRAFQVEDFESLEITNIGNSPAGVQIDIEKTFCICCKENKDCDPCNSCLDNRHRNQCKDCKGDRNCNRCKDDCHPCRNSLN